VLFTPSIERRLPDELLLEIPAGSCDYRMSRVSLARAAGVGLRQFAKARVAQACQGAACRVGPKKIGAPMGCRMRRDGSVAPSSTQLAPLEFACASLIFESVVALSVKVLKTIVFHFFE
jgi:hypothetical protein